MSILENPKVSVSVISYNQEKCIAECLESILSQKAGFSFEIVIGDDASTDDTQKIIRRFQNKYPNIIRSILRDANTGGTENYYDVVAACHGEYIVHIDGDDRMAPGKLAKQTAFLDAHPECSMVVHRVEIFNGLDGKVMGFSPVSKQPLISDINYLVERNQFFAHSSKMYRRSANIFPRRKETTIDFFFSIEHASVGKIGYLDEILGGYRKTPETISDPNNPQFFLLVKCGLDAFNRARALGVPEHVVARGISKFKTQVSVNCLEKRNWAQFRTFLVESASTTVGFIGIEHYLLYCFRDMPRTARLLWNIRAKLTRVASRPATQP